MPSTPAGRLRQTPRTSEPQASWSPAWRDRETHRRADAHAPAVCPAPPHAPQGLQAAPRDGSSRVQSNCPESQPPCRLTRQIPPLGPGNPTCAGSWPCTPTLSPQPPAPAADVAPAPWAQPPAPAADREQLLPAENCFHAKRGQVHEPGQPQPGRVVQSITQGFRGAVPCLWFSWSLPFSWGHASHRSLASIPGFPSGAPLQTGAVP